MAFPKPGGYRWESMRLLYATACLGGLFAACAEPAPEEQASAPAAVQPAALPSGPLRTLAGSAEGPTFLYERRGEMIDPRLGTVPVLDPVRHRVLLQGGWSSATVRNDTIEWDGLGWQRRVSSGQPGARFGSATVYDTRFGRTLAVGGFSTTSPSLDLASNAVWEWNGADWAELTTEAPPPPRGGAMMAQNPITKEIWLFGGSLRAEGALVTTDELFRFDGIRWTKIEKVAGQPWPAPRSSPAFAWDPGTSSMMLFGGFGIFNADESGAPSIGEPRLDTWTWNGTTWTEHVTARSPVGEVFHLPSGAPVPLSGRQALLLDPKSNSLVLVHESLGGVELWRYDAATPTWIPLSTTVRGGTGPNYRLLSNAFIDPVSGDVVVTGGIGSKIPYGFTRIDAALALAADEDVTAYFAGEMTNEQWSFDGTTWHARTAPGDPGPRVDASAAFAEDRGQAILFGGRFGSSTTLGDTWIWNGGHWTEAAVGASQPPPRRAHAMAYDPKREAVVLFGGLDAADVPLNDVWIWKDGWSQLTLPDGPTGRSNHQLLRVADGVMLYGGLDGAGVHTRETWLLHSRPDAWERLADSGTGNSYQSCGASSAVTGPYLFGGVRFQDQTGTDDFTHFDEAGRVWSFVDIVDGTYELQERRLCALFADPVRQQITIGGGLGGALDSNWNRYDVASRLWQVTTPRTYDRLMDPPRRIVAPAYFFDTKVGAPTYYGGRAPGVNTVTAETWRIRQVGDACGENGACSDGSTCVDGVCCESSACGPCETCALPGNRGVCMPRGVVESAPGCAAEAGLACNPSGRCRAGDGSSCTADPQCASGTCIGGTCCSAAGCAQSCKDESTQRNPNGTETPCGAYACRGSACLATCTTLSDCTEGNVCSVDGRCVAGAGASGEAPGGCSTHGVPASGSLVSGLSLLLLLWRRTRTC